LKWDFRTFVTAIFKSVCGYTFRTLCMCFFLILWDFKHVLLVVIWIFCHQTRTRELFTVISILPLYSKANIIIWYVPLYQCIHSRTFKQKKNKKSYGTINLKGRWIHLFKMVWCLKHHPFQARNRFSRNFSFVLFLLRLQKWKWEKITKGIAYILQTKTLCNHSHLSSSPKTTQQNYDCMQ